jgi:hypothetical protein
MSAILTALFSLSTRGTFLCSFVFLQPNNLLVATVKLTLMTQLLPTWLAQKPSTRCLPGCVGCDSLGSADRNSRCQLLFALCTFLFAATLGVCCACSAMGEERSSSTRFCRRGGLRLKAESATHSRAEQRQGVPKGPLPCQRQSSHRGRMRTRHTTPLVQQKQLRRSR